MHSEIGTRDRRVLVRLVLGDVCAANLGSAKAIQVTFSLVWW